jgi:hypothetical protein
VVDLRLVAKRVLPILLPAFAAGVTPRRRVEHRDVACCCVYRAQQRRNGARAPRGNCHHPGKDPLCSFSGGGGVYWRAMAGTCWHLVLCSYAGSMQAIVKAKIFGRMPPGCAACRLL